MLHTIFFPLGGSKTGFFLQAGHKVDFIALRWAKNPFYDPLVEKISCAAQEKYLFYLCDCYSRFAWASNFTLAIVYYATREKKVYFASVKFDARAKQGQQSHK